MTLLSLLRYKIESALNIQTRCEHTFYAGSLTPQSRIIDLGGNRGEFAGHISKTYGCRCVVVEPMPELCAGITRTDLIEPVNAAISDRNGEMLFFAAHSAQFVR